jgi:phage terminase large subunit-like protein
MAPRSKKSPAPSTNSSTEDHVTKANTYIDGVLSGKIDACKWVKRACERQRNDLAKQGTPGFPYRFDATKAGRICRFIEQLPHIKGPLAGKCLVLEPWQCFVLTTAFGWLNDGGQFDGKRRYRRAYIEVPRGNGKSALSSGVALYCLTADGESGAEVYSAATTRDQARIVFRDAQNMARRSTKLMGTLGVEVLAEAITVLPKASVFKALSAEGHTLDGLNIHLAVVDELHAHKTRDVYDVLETGAGKRDQSLIWAITTAGFNRAGICYEQRTYLTKLLDGVAADESYFGCIWTLDDTDDWTQESSWIKANPNWGVSVMPNVVAQLAAKAMQMPAATNNFLTKHCNKWVNADTAWMDMRAWDRCADPSLDLADFDGQPCTIGLDLATKTDIAAKIRLFEREIDGTRHYYVFGQYYLPEVAASDGRNSQYAGWEIEGRLTTTAGDVLDFEAVEDDLIEDSRRFQVREIAYDPWQATQLAQRLQQQGASVIEYRNTVANFSAPMKEVDALVRSGRLHHDGDPVLGWMVSNVICHVDAKDNIYPRKERHENKIDGLVALIMALGRVMTAEPEAELQVFI